MKIAMTHVDLPNEAKGGVAHQVHYLANVLVERGHQVTMHTFSPAFPECRYQVRQYSSGRLTKGNSFRSFLLAVRLAKTDFTEFDILHTNGDNYCLKGRHPQVRTFYGSAKDEARSAVRFRRRVYQWVISYLEQVGARVADVSVGISEATRLRIPRVSVIIPCGVDLECFRPGPKSENPTILFVGTVGGRKRGQFLADIFEREIRPKFPNAELWAVAERPMPGEGVVNFGKVDLETLTRLYRQAWAFCLPSTYEGFGVPYIEAMASGTAVVASPNLGAQEVLSGGRFGLIASDKTLGDRLGAILADKEMRDEYTIKGLTRAQDFRWDVVASQYEQLYARLI